MDAHWIENLRRPAEQHPDRRMRAWLAELLRLRDERRASNHGL
jgi:hypothetical protein